MASLLELHDSAKSIKIRGVDVKVTGLSISGFAELAVRIPQFREMIDQGSIDIEDAIILAKQMPGPFIAAGCGHLGDEKAEGVASALGAQDQAVLIDAIIKVTAPDGVGPFVETLTRMANEYGLSAQGTEAEPKGAKGAATSIDSDKSSKG